MPRGYVKKIPIFRKCTLYLVLKEPDVWDLASYGSKEKVQTL